MDGPELLRRALLRMNLTPAEFCRRHPDFCDSEISRYLSGGRPGLDKAFLLHELTKDKSGRRGVPPRAWCKPFEQASEKRAAG